jgi:predicted transcriptional regulator
MDKLLERIFASRAQTRVVQHFLDRPKEYLNLSRIANETGLAHSTIHRVMQPLIRLFILETEDEKSKVLADFYAKIKPMLQE